MSNGILTVLMSIPVEEKFVAAEELIWNFL